MAAVSQVKGERFARLTPGEPQIPTSASLTTFLGSDDIMCHMFKFIPYKNRQDMTFVCKSWNRLSYMMSTWRKVRLVFCSSADTSLLNPGIEAAEYLQELQELFLKEKHIKNFVLVGTTYQTTEWWTELATAMTHIETLSIIMKVVSETSTSETPFRLASLPNLTSLTLPVDHHWVSSVSLDLPALENLEICRGGNYPTDGDDFVLDIKCRKMKDLKVSIWKNMILPPSLFTHLRSLDLMVHSLPDGILRNVGRDLVLDDCPQLTSFQISLTKEAVGDITLVLSLPSLERFTASKCLDLEKCKFKLPKLEHVSLLHCPKLALPEAIMAQLKSFTCYASFLAPPFTSNEDGRGRSFILTGCPLLEKLHLRLLLLPVSLTLNFPNLRDLFLQDLDKLKFCTLSGSLLSKLSVTSCPLFKVSSLFKHTLYSLELCGCIVSDDVWNLPSLRLLRLGQLKAKAANIGIVSQDSSITTEQRFRITSIPQLQHLDLEWKEHVLLGAFDIDKVGISVSIEHGTTLRVVGMSTLFQLRIVAPNAKELTIKGTEALRQLDVECPLVESVEMENCPRIEEE